MRNLSFKKVDSEARSQKSEYRVRLSTELCLLNSNFVSLSLCG